MSTDNVSTQALDLPLTVDVTEGHIPSVPFPRSMYSANSCYHVYSDGEKGGQTPFLPKWLYIKDRDGLYLTVRDGADYATLTFRTGDPDLKCAFEAVVSGDRYKFLGRNGKYIRWYYTAPGPWYSCDGVEAEPSYHLITTTGDYIYLKNAFWTNFISNELTANGSPLAHDYINDSSLFEIVQAAVKNEITNVNYDIPGGAVLEAAPLIALSITVRNDSDDSDLEQTLSYEYEKWSVGTWNNTAGVELGAKSTFKAGVPFVASAEFEISVSASYSHEWGGEEGEKQTITSSTKVTVPPKKKARATIIIRNAQIDIGFTYTQTILWLDGKSETQQKTGIYRNVDSWHVDVVLDNWEDV